MVSATSAARPASPLAVVVPAYQAEAQVGGVVSELRRELGSEAILLVVDDGSRDATARVAEAAGARVLRHAQNRGKGAALRTGFAEALRVGAEVALCVDADGQHPAAEARRLHAAVPDLDALVLGVRDLVAAGAPRANQRSNAFSNLAISAFVGRRLADTQCGLRRYPLAATLALGGREDGYGYEAEILIRAVAAGLQLIELPVTVLYPPEGERVTHFDSVRDPARIVRRVLATVAETRVRAFVRRLARLGSRAP